MRDDDGDYAIYAAWRNQAHVRHWWDPDDPPMDVSAARAECRPAITGADPTTMCFIERANVAIGFVQFYDWASYPEEVRQMDVAIPAGAWGLDIFIGEKAALGRGVGSTVVAGLGDYLFERGAGALMFGVDRDNRRAQRAYIKAGMSPTREYVDIDIRDGARITSVLMERYAGPASARPQQ